MQPRQPRYWQDTLFHASIAAGIAYWVALFLIVRPQPEFDWPLRAPLQDLAHRHLKAWHIGPLTHANLLTSLVFTALHFIAHPPLWAAAVFLPSLLFGFFKDRSGTLAAPILLHVFYNSGYFWLFTRIAPGS
jgi:hypothetical protein